MRISSRVLTMIVVLATAMAVVVLGGSPPVRAASNVISNSHYYYFVWDPNEGVGWGDTPLILDQDTDAIEIAVQNGSQSGYQLYVDGQTGLCIYYNASNYLYEHTCNVSRPSDNWDSGVYHGFWVMSNLYVNEVNGVCNASLGYYEVVTGIAAHDQLVMECPINGTSYPSSQLWSLDVLGNT
jgi:hypothetical protein